MYNPSYLIKSRHDIYYFRYPVPMPSSEKVSRVSCSLRTRCPREALRLAKALEYHSANLLNHMDLRDMKHSEVMTILKTYYAEVLERAKTRILPPQPIFKVNLVLSVIIFPR